MALPNDRWLYQVHLFWNTAEVLFQQLPSQLHVYTSRLELPFNLTKEN